MKYSVLLLLICMACKDKINLCDYYKANNHVSETTSLLLGDSRFELLNTDSIKNHCYNFGTRYYTTLDVINHLTYVEKVVKQCNIAYIHVGRNDASKGSSVELYSKNMSHIVAWLKMHYNCKVVIINNIPDIYAMHTEHISSLIADYNKALIHLEGVEIVDLYPLFTIEGYLNPDLSSDGIHYNDKGKSILYCIFNK